MEKKDKRKKILKVSGLIGLFLIVFGLSYALFTVTLNGTKKVKIKTGKLELQLLDKNNNPIYSTSNNSESSYEINLDNQVPISDEEGLESTAFEFKLKNSGNLNANYTIYLDDVALEEGETRIDDEYIRYSLTKNGSEENPQGLTSRQLDKGTIDTDNTTYTYTLKIWIKEDATNDAMDKVFNATLRVEGTQYVPEKSLYGTKIAETQLSETITATYYQPNGTGYNSEGTVKRMSNVQNIDNDMTYEGGTLVVSGTGEIPNPQDNNYKLVLFLADVSTVEELQDLMSYSSHGDIVMDYKYNPSLLVIDEGITKIGTAAFMSMYNSIAEVRFPSTLKIIDRLSFAYLGNYIRDNLNGVLRIPSGVEEVGYDAFHAGLITSDDYHYSGFSEVYLPASIKSFVMQDMDDNSIIYCETQEVADLLDGQYDSSQTQVIVDPTKF